MSEKLQSILSGFLPKLVSALQAAPWQLWAILGGLLVAFVIYLWTLPRRRRVHVARELVSETQSNQTGEWFGAAFPGKVVHRFLRLRVKELSYKGKVIKFDDLDTYSWGIYPSKYWERDHKIPNDVSVAAFRQQRRSRQFPLKAIIAIGGLFVVGLLGWFVVRPAIERQRGDQEAVIVIGREEQGESLVGEEFKMTPVAPNSTPEPTPMPERVDPYSIVVDLDKPAAPGQLEQMLLALADKLPVFPDIIPEWIEFGAAKHPTQIASLEGMEGFVIVFATDSGLELHRTTDELVRVGEPLFIADYKATLLARSATKGVGYDVKEGEWLETIDYPRGKLRVLITEHGNPALVVVSTGMTYNHRPWHPWAAIGAVILAVVIVIWRRRH